MSYYGYPRLTTPHLDKFMQRGTAFENAFSPHIPTTPGYGSMFTGMDTFGMDVVALRHQGGLAPHLKTLAEILGAAGYTTTCVGFKGNPASRGFQNYIDFEGWGSWEAGRSHKAENLNNVTLPEMRRLAKAGDPFFLFLRHMDPHSPYLPPQPFDRMFYEGNEFDKKNKSLDPVMTFKPFCDYFASWFPPGCTDKDYVIAQYDGELAYMDACIGEYFHHAGNAQPGRRHAGRHRLRPRRDALRSRLLLRPSRPVRLHAAHPAGVHPAGQSPRRAATPRHRPDEGRHADHPGPAGRQGGRQVRRAVARAADERAELRRLEPEFYITECTWMRKHGWRTPQWKLIHALEPDFHFKSEVELYDLIRDPEENNNLASKEPGVVAMLEARMNAWVALREKQTGRQAPIYSNLNWHGAGCGPFKTSQQAYDTMHIGSPNAAKNLQELQRQRGQKKL